MLLYAMQITQILISDRYRVNCPCCGGMMEKVQDLETSILMKCKECGLSDTVLK